MHCYGTCYGTLYPLIKQTKRENSAIYYLNPKKIWRHLVKRSTYIKTSILAMAPCASAGGVQKAKTKAKT